MPRESVFMLVQIDST